MSYVVLARKWRPMTFRDLVGQGHVSRTLSNAIQQQRVAHAFLFTGVRGVGKTTSARILAKALNCLRGARAQEEGELAEPCLECSACKEIAAGTDVDVREIDGASYTGVDEIRKLQESLPYPPTRDPNKIFIVDEVHMLSNNAWNALLKTLEEPPPHVKFIFATTEAHKVPITILSRVQRFDFKLIPSRLVADRVREILQHESIEADEEAVSLVAREAAGSMRDALSTLDQAIAFAPGKLIGEQLAQVLGVAGHKTMHSIARAVLMGDAQSALQLVAQLAEQSCELSVVARDILRLFRDLVVARVCDDPATLLDLPDSEREAVVALAREHEQLDLVRLHQGFADGFDRVTRAADPRAALEMLLVRLCYRPPLLPLDGLVSRLESLEKRLGGSPPTGSGRAGSKSSSAAQPSRRKQPPSSSDSPPADRGTNLASLPSAFSAAPPVQPEPHASQPGTRTEVERQVAYTPCPPGDEATPANDTPGRSAPLARQPEEGVDPLKTTWRRILATVEEQRPDVSAFMKHAVALQLTPERVSLGSPKGNVLETAMQSDEAVRVLQAAAQQHLGGNPKVHFETISPAAGTLADEERAERAAARQESLRRARQHPSVQEAVEVLGARVKNVEVG